MNLFESRNALYSQSYALPLRFRGAQAEGEGFEPSVRDCRTTLFESAPFDHSGTLPTYASTP